MEMVETFEQLGERIRQARLGRGLDQSALARDCGLGRTQISRIESGERRVSALELSRLARALKLSLGDLLVLPAPDARAARTPLEEHATSVEKDRFEAQRELDALWRDACQLRDLDLLDPADWTCQTPQDEAQARDLAHRARRFLVDARLLPDKQAPIGPVADTAAAFGLWTYVVDLEVEGLSLSPDPGFGVAVVGGRLEPGRRRMTAAHELGHHLSGDTYGEDGSQGHGVRDRRERERLTDVFAAEFLLPADAASAVVRKPDRDAMIVLAARYRVSFSVVTTTLRQHGARLTGTDLTSPSDSDFYAAGVERPAPDLKVGCVPTRWIQACVRAERQHMVSRARAQEMARRPLQ